MVPIDTSAEAACQFIKTIKNGSYNTFVLDSLVHYSTYSLKISGYFKNSASPVISISLKVPALDIFQHKGLNNISKRYLLHQVYPDQLVQELLCQNHMIHIGVPEGDA